MKRQPTSKSIVVLTALALLAASCSGGGAKLDVSTATTGSTPTTTRPAPRETEPPTPGTNTGVDGALRFGASHKVVESTVAPNGGQVAIPRGPLSGLAVDVPAGSYGESMPFEVTLTEIQANTFGAAVKPLTPLITVDNGGAYSDEIMTVRIPVRIPDGMFAMGFLYDGGKLEALPLVEEGPDHVTIATRHFSSFFVSAIEYALLPPDVGTGFRVQEDNWQFTNYGTYPEPNGICAGMSLTSMWYFLERKASDGQLWNRWDDDGQQDTPSFWYDDAFALRWATKVHSVLDWDALTRKISKAIAAQGHERLQYDAFRYAMYVTGEPQYVGLNDAGGGSGHAMVVYAQTPGSLWIADPNYPKDLREIRFDEATGEFKTYSSGTDAAAIAAGNDVAYERFALIAKTALIPWATIGDLYEKMKAGIVGAGLFPPYQLLVRTTLDDGSTFTEPLRSGYLTSLPAIQFGVSPTFDATVSVFEGTSETALGQFNVPTAPTFISLPLGLGANQVGIGIMGGLSSTAANMWIDFRRLTIYRDEAATTTSSPPTAPPPTAPPPTSPPTTEDCSQYEQGSIAWVRCSIQSGAISD